MIDLRAHSVGQERIRSGGAVLPDCPMPSRGRSTRYFKFMDHRGTAHAVVDESKVVVASRLFNAFGGVTFETGTWPADVPFRYQSNWLHLTDLPDGSPLYLSPTRVYHAGVGRFLQRDIVRSGPNRYTYGHCNPVGSVDPNGLDPVYTVNIFVPAFWYVGNSYFLQYTVARRNVQIGGSAYMELTILSTEDRAYANSLQLRLPYRLAGTEHQHPSELEPLYQAVNAVLIEDALRALCPDKEVNSNPEEGGTAQCCTPEGCREQAREIGTAVAAKVYAVRAPIVQAHLYVRGGLRGNLSTGQGQTGPGRQCEQWALDIEPVVWDVTNRHARAGENCFKYQQLRKTTGLDHIWVGIYGPTNKSKRPADRDVDLDPWPSGGVEIVRSKGAYAPQTGGNYNPK